MGLSWLCSLNHATWQKIIKQKFWSNHDLVGVEHMSARPIVLIWKKFMPGAAVNHFHV
jgi:hypothetical protein